MNFKLNFRSQFVSAIAIPAFAAVITATQGTAWITNFFVNYSEKFSRAKPGYEAFFAIVGLLAVAYLVLRQRK